MSIQTQSRRQKVIQLFTTRHKTKILPKNTILHRKPAPAPIIKEESKILTTYIPKKKYTIRLLYDTAYWAYYWSSLALQKYAPDDFDVDIGNEYTEATKHKRYDLILQNCFSYAAALKKHTMRVSPSTIVCSVYSVGWGYANDWLDLCIRDSDNVIINNVEMWEKHGKRPNTFQISNGIDLGVFGIKKPIELRKTPRVLWCGSKIHRGVKNYDSIIVPLEKMLAKDKIQFDFRLVDSVGPNRMNQSQMNYWYNTGTILVVSSKTEGTPNTLHEGCACGCVPVATRVGNVPEIVTDGVNGFICDTNVQSIYGGIKKAIPRYQEMATAANSTIQGWDWKYKSVEYFDYFRKLIAEKRCHL